MTTSLKVVLNLKSELRREVVLQVIGQLPAHLIAIDFYEIWFVRHEYHRSIGCHSAEKVTLAIVFAFHLTFETFVTVLNPTAT